MQKEIKQLKEYINRTRRVDNKEVKKNSILKFKKNDSELLNKNIQSSIISVRDSFWILSDNLQKTPENIRILNKVYDQIKRLDQNNITNTIDAIIEIEDELKKVKVIHDFKINLNHKRLPIEVKDEIIADFSETQKCYQNGSYRSSIILCGRVLEIALHRKYFELTNLDILEKNPGIGLGTLIAKLQEKNIKFDPGITQQIHLINQTRIHSVHIKKETFYPTKTQAQAIMLLTQDILEKLF